MSAVVSEAFNIKKVQPSYSEEARQKHIQGKVVMKAEISQTGDVEELTVISGDPLLNPAAVDAVMQWKYKPYLLKGQPIALETQVSVVFQLTE